MAEPRNDQLDEQIFERPDDPAAYLVYGDWLEQLGHPRGALIAAHAAGNDEAAAAILAEHRAALVPPEVDPMRCDWHFGFLRALWIGTAIEEVAVERVTAAVASQSARFLRQLHLWSVPARAIELATRFGRTLEALTVMAHEEVVAQLEPGPRAGPVADLLLQTMSLERRRTRALGPRTAVIDDRALEPLRRLPRLSRLTLSPCHAASESGLRAVPHVTPAAIESLRAMPALTALDLGDFPASDATAYALSRLSLRELRMTGDHAELTSAGVRELARLPLTSLALGGAVSSTASPYLASLAHHESLEHVELVNTVLDDPVGATLATLPRLRSITAQPAEDDGVRALAPLARTGLRALRVGGRHVTNAACAVIGTFTELRSLSVAASAITGDALPLLRGLGDLAQLDLSSTRLDDGAMHLLLQFPALVHLSLSDTPITNAAIEALAQIPRLEVLSIVGTAIDEDGAARLAAMPGMRKLLRGNRLALARAARDGGEPTRRNEPHGSLPWHVRWFGELAFLDDHLATVTSQLDARFPAWPATSPR
jgi:uncharacterized protein (TIGR02996 family)